MNNETIEASPEKFVCYGPAGNPIYVVTPSAPGLYFDGLVVDGSTFKSVAHESDDHLLLQTTYLKDGLVKVRSPRQGAYMHWSVEYEAWLPNLDAARESQRQAWNAWRDRELVAGFSHNGYVFHSDDTFVGELQLLLKGYERGYLTSTSAIRTRDNGTLQMTHAEIENLLLLIGLHRQAIYAQSWTGKDALASLTTLEDIMAGGPPS